MILGKLIRRMEILISLLIMLLCASVVLKGTLLETARIQICKIEAEETLTTRILFDTESQR